MLRIGSFFLVGVVVGCATGPGEDAARLEGTVLRGPVTPVCIEEVPCDLPFAGQFDVERLGRRVTRFESDAAGRFTVRLAPGDYAIRWIGGGLGPLGQVRAVSVERPVTDVELHFDTGIR